MKRLIIVYVLSVFFLIPGQTQDLIRNTLSGKAYANSETKSNAIAELIADRKQQKAVFSAYELFKVQPYGSKNRYQKSVTEAVLLELDAKALTQFWDYPTPDIQLHIPVASEKNILIEATLTRPMAPDFQVLNSSGKREAYPSEALFYQGIVHGNSNSMVAISIFKDYLRIFIADQGGNYVLGRLSEQNQDYIFYNDKNLTSPPTFDCSTSDLHYTAQAHSPRPPTTGAKRDQGDCIEIYVECDFNLYQDLGSDLNNVVDYTLALFHEVGVLYRVENINVELSQIVVWTIPDPYVSATSTGTALELFGENLQDNYNGRLAHLLSGRFSGGIAWLDQLCNTYFTFDADFDDDGEDELHHAGPYGVSGVGGTVNNVFTYSGSVLVVTHELGHNMGSRHTHACVWNGNDTQIDDCGNVGTFSPDGVFDDDDDGIEDDGCYNPFADPPQVPIIPEEGGTIMSYCHTSDFGIDFILGFGPQPGDLIRDKIANADCLKEFCSCDEFVNRIVNGAPISSAVYTASNSISSSGDVNGGIVVFQAGNFIELQPGFEATPFFMAKIQSDLCNDSGSSFTSTPLIEDELKDKGSEAEPAQESIKIWPNPAHTSLQISFSLATDEQITLLVLNAYGQKIHTLVSGQLRAKGKHQERIQLGNWPEGVYYLQLQSSQEVFSQPFVVSQQ